MAENSQDISNNIATRVIVALSAVSAIFILISYLVLYFISHNSYASIYYTLGSLFDANGEGAGAYIAATLAGRAGYFLYWFIGISIVDGIAKAVLVGFLIGAFINLLSGLDIKSKLDVITAKRQRGHVIICGYSMLAERLCTDLKKAGMKALIIEKSAEKVNLLQDLKLNVLEGDFTEKRTLENASLKNAKAVVFATESDFINLLGIVTAHHMYENVKIISRAVHESSIRKMQRGGASLCLVPEVVAGVEIGESIVKM